MYFLYPKGQVQSREIISAILLITSCGIANSGWSCLCKRVNHVISQIRQHRVTNEKLQFSDKLFFFFQEYFERPVTFGWHPTRLLV